MARNHQEAVGTRETRRKSDVRGKSNPVASLLCVCDKYFSSDDMLCPEAYRNPGMDLGSKKP